MKLLAPPDETEIARLRATCADYYGRDAADVQVIRSPYRLCPLGAHIDHQLGPVSAFATPHCVRLAFAPDKGRQVVINSRGYPGEIRFDLQAGLSRQQDWADYARGAASVLGKREPLVHGVSLWIEGELAEAGLSSSAAVGLGYLASLCRVNGIETSPARLVEFDRQIENDFMGLANGILDPAAIAHALPNELTVIHCKDRSVESFAGGEGFCFIAVYSGLHEALVQSPRFNNRVAECREAGGNLARLAGLELNGPQPLGVVSESDWQTYGGRLSDLEQRLARHFFTESARVLAGADAWRRSDVAEFGALMNASCLSSINDYETGCPEMVRLVEILAETRGVHGARFCGAGFRGCCIALVERSRIGDILDLVASRYLADYPQFKDEIWAIEAAPSSGLHLI